MWRRSSSQIPPPLFLFAPAQLFSPFFSLLINYLYYDNTLNHLKLCSLWCFNLKREKERKKKKRMIWFTFGR